MFRFLPPPRPIEVAAAAVLATSALFGASAIAAPPARSRMLAKELIGSWTLLAADVLHADGSVDRDYGPSPRGRMIVDGEGRYTVLIYRSDLPKFTSGDRTKGTPQEYRDSVTGMSTHFGTLTADSVAGTLTFSVEAAGFANWNGTDLVRPYTLKDGVLRYTGAARPNGDVPVSVWKKVA